MPELREAIARKLERENGLRYDPESEIIVTAGAQEGMFVALFGTLNPGDEVIAADPHYRVYDEVIALCGASVSIVPTVVETGFQIDTAALRAAITPRTRGILVVSPDNPTGSVQNRQAAERSPPSPASTISLSTPTSSTSASSSTAPSTSVWPRCRGCTSGRSPSTVSPRPTP